MSELLQVRVGFRDGEPERVLGEIYNAWDFDGFIHSLFVLHHLERLSSSRL